MHAFQHSMRVSAFRPSLFVVSVVAAAVVGCADAPTAVRSGAVAADVVSTGTLNSGSGSLASGDRVNINIPTQFAIQDRCAGGRFGEIIVFQGNQHLVFNQVTTTGGHINMKVQWNANDITGVGQYTGFTYRATGVTQDHTVSNATLPYEETMINNYHVIGQGSATNGDLHETTHFTVNANGDVTAVVTDYNFDCKGTPSF